MNELLPLERDGRALPTVLRLPGIEPPWPLVVFVHGWLGHPRKFTRLLDRWAAAGYAVAAPAFSRTNDEADMPDYEDVSAQPDDVRRVLDHFTDDERIDSDRIAVGGFSLGAVTALAVVFGSRPDTRTSAAIAISGCAPWFAEWTPRRCPLLVVHGRCDEAVPYEDGREVYGAARPPKALLTIEVPGHSEHVEDDPGTAAAHVVDDVTTAFLDHVLRGWTAPRPDVDPALGVLESDGIW